MFPGVFFCIFGSAIGGVIAPYPCAGCTLYGWWQRQALGVGRSASVRPLSGSGGVCRRWCKGKGAFPHCRSLPGFPLVHERFWVLGLDLVCNDIIQT